ncbi:MAG: hypothetical protein WA175_06410 [Candidatus Acidiferrales bacterium]
MRKPLPSRGPVVFAATFLVCVSAFTLSSREENSLVARVPLVEDWSHHHLVFSQPANMWQAAQLRNDPRYWHQYYRENARTLSLTGGDALATSLASAGSQQGVHSDWGVPLVGGATVGAGNFPAKFTFNINAPPSCTADYVVFNTSTTGALQLVAFNNLYVGQTSGESGGADCTSTTGPSILFAYDTRLSSEVFGTTASTSVILSLDGTEIAFVESDSAGARLKVLRWHAGDGGTIATPVKPTNTTLTTWSACAAGQSCLITVPFGNGKNDTISSVYYDYSTDNAYVGDANGVLHKFTGVFFGTPAEDTTNDGAGGTAWPITVDSGHALSSPVYDSVSGNIYVGDSTGRLSFVRTASSTVGTCSPLPCLNATHLSVGTGGSIVAGPVVDSTTGQVFAINGTETTDDGVILQAPTSFASSVTENIGSNSGTTGVAMRGGGFDYSYLTSPAGSKTGHLYVCGKVNDKVVAGATDRPALFQLGFTAAGVLNSVSTAFQVGNPSGGACSPITHFYNSGTATDWIFFSVGSNVFGAPAGSPCKVAGASACVLSINVTAGTWPPTINSASPVPTNAAAGTSGIVVDNVGAGSQESSIYFTYGANAVAAESCDGTTGKGCAVKETQSGLD